VKPFGRAPVAIWKQRLRGNFMDLMEVEKVFAIHFSSGKVKEYSFFWD
jgi:hypothetical protein